MFPVIGRGFVTYTVNGFVCKYQIIGNHMYIYAPEAAVASCGSIWYLVPSGFFLNALSISPDNPLSDMVELIGILDKDGGEDEPEKECEHVYVNVSFTGATYVCKHCGEGT